MIRRVLIVFILLFVHFYNLADEDYHREEVNVWNLRQIFQLVTIN